MPTSAQNLAQNLAPQKPITAADIERAYQCAWEVIIRSVRDAVAQRSSAQ